MRERELNALGLETVLSFILSICSLRAHTPYTHLEISCTAVSYQPLLLIPPNRLPNLRHRLHLALSGGTLVAEGSLQERCLFIHVGTRRFARTDQFARPRFPLARLASLPLPVPLPPLRPLPSPPPGRSWGQP